MTPDLNALNARTEVLANRNLRLVALWDAERRTCRKWRRIAFACCAISWIQTTALVVWVMVR